MTKVKLTVSHTLEERAKTHGDFTENADISRELKEIVWKGSKWGQMTNVQKEALEVILAKAARIVTGNPNHKDSWHDIGGYAKLAEDRIK